MMKMNQIGCDLKVIFNVYQKNIPKIYAIKPASGLSKESKRLTFRAILRKVAVENEFDDLTSWWINF
jgi:hypothetical protein